MLDVELETTSISSEHIESVTTSSEDEDYEEEYEDENDVEEEEKETSSEHIDAVKVCETGFRLFENECLGR